MNEQVLETVHLEALLMAALLGRVSTAHDDRGHKSAPPKELQNKKSLPFERLFLLLLTVVSQSPHL
jgi:hypothetical protein